MHTTPPPYLAIVLSCRVSAILDLEPTFSSWLIRSLEATFEDGIVDEICMPDVFGDWEEP